VTYLRFVAGALKPKTPSLGSIALRRQGARRPRSALTALSPRPYQSTTWYFERGPGVHAGNGREQAVRSDLSVPQWEVRDRSA